MDISIVNLLSRSRRLLLGVLIFSAFSASAQVSITCPAPILAPNEAGLCGATVSFIDPIGVGTGTNITTTQTAGLPSGSFFNVGIHTIEFIVTNDEGDSDVCAFDIEVEDTEDPVFDCPPDIFIDADPATCTTVVNFLPPTATDNCDIFSIIQIGGPPSGSAFPVGETNIDFKADDIHGNSDFCRFKIIVADVTDPVITCPANVNLSVSTSCDSVYTYVAPVGTDACTIANTVQTGGLGSGATFPIGTTTETYTVTDLAGNSSECSFDIIVSDGAPPEITCNADIVVAALPGECEVIVNFNDATAIDNCGVASIVQTSGLASGSSFPAGANTIEYTATDDAGNMSTCTFTVTVTEDVNPTITCPADLVVDTDLDECSAIVVLPIPTADDFCDDPVVTQTGGILSGDAFPVGTSTVEFSATDLSGNTAICTYDVIVNDTQDPTFICPTDITVTAPIGQCEEVANFAEPIPADNCPGVSISQTSGPASGSLFPVGSTEIEYTAEDAAGNTTICTFNIIVEDNEDPEITCPADFTVAIPNGNCSGQITYPDPVFSDNCPGATFSVLSGPASGDVVSTGIHSVELQVTDASGNTANCTFEITVTESSDPVFVCPADLEVPADPGSCEAVVNFSLPTAMDSCSTVTVTQTGGPASGTVFPAGGTLLEFSAEDEYGNTATCAYTITVVDDTDPEITCPADITTDADPGICGAIVNYAAPVVDDNCGILSVDQTAGIGSGNEFPVGTTTETYVVTDVSGNTATCSFSVTVNDNENPTITCQADIDMVLAGGDCEAIVNYDAPIADDNCPGVTVTLIDGLASGETFPSGITTVTYEAEDAAGNTETCSFLVSITENIDPEITCPTNITVSNDPGECGAIVNYTPPVGTDNCDGAVTTLTAGLPPGSFFPISGTTVTYTVTDLSGNTATCSFLVKVEDTELPIMDCSTDITVSTDPGVCEAVVNYPIPTAVDNCTDALVPTLSSGLISGSTFPIGITHITYEVSDDDGNTASCSFNIIVEDQELPEITCPMDITIDAISGDCDAIVNYVVPTATDNCPGVVVSLTDGLNSGELFPVGTTLVEYEAVDAAGNSAVCSFNVTVLEDVLPTIDCPGNITQSNDAGLCGAIVNYTAPIGTDNCGSATTALIAGLAPGSEFPVGTTTVTYQVTDLSGNQAECSFDVEITDEEAPEFVCPTDAVLSADLNCEFVYIFDLPAVTDNCSDNMVVTQTEGPVSGTVLALGSTTFTFTTSDEAGNLATCSYIVTVVDDTPPVFDTCPADAVVFVGADACDAIASFIEPTASDNCGLTLSQTAGPVNNAVLAPGVYDYTYEAVDDAGNVSLCEFSITVQDDILPEIDCEPDFETCDTAPVFNTPTATDNCAIAQVIQIAGPTSGSTFPVGVSQITFEATDVNGNTNICSFEITVLDNAPDADAGEDQNICDARSTTIEGNDPDNAAGTWTLLSGSGTIDSPNTPSTTVNNLGDGENVFVWSLDPGNSCSINSDSVSVFVEAGVIVEAGSDILLENAGSAVLTPTVSPPGGDFLWTPDIGLNCTDCQNPMASPSETTLYFLTYTTPLGCEKTDSVYVRVFDEFPNTITPDGDGVNDVWNIPGIENYPDVHVVIYNRWGNEVYESSGYHEPWDGTEGGDDLPAASYYYIIDYKVSGKEVLNGTVNIIR